MDFKFRFLGVTISVRVNIDRPAIRKEWNPMVNGPVGRKAH